MKNWIIKHKGLVLYAVFGVATTLINFIAFRLCNWLFGNDWYLVNNVIAWVFAVIFAYVVNKVWVFESRSWAFAVIGREIAEFLTARLLSLGIEEVGLLLLVDVLGMKDLMLNLFGLTFSGPFIAKLILAVVVVVLNYFFSKFIIFKKKN
ncbi:MAG: GtrA family protein [Clostridia bacterium]|nr:GtrA family protein [Clostridia bacterium]